VRCGTDPDESTVMDCDIAIYQTVDADADSDGPGSDRGRAQSGSPRPSSGHLFCVSYKHIILSGLSRAEPSRAEPSGAEPSAEPEGRGTLGAHRDSEGKQLF
jgi:hypothetical protein